MKISWLQERVKKISLLSERELAIARLLQENHTEKELAARYKKKEGSLKKEIATIKEKLDVTHLIQIAVVLYWQELTTPGADVGEPPIKTLDQLLTQREFDIVCHFTDGLRDAEIAPKVGMTANSVKNYVRIIRTKLGLDTRIDVAQRLMRDRYFWILAHKQYHHPPKAKS